MLNKGLRKSLYFRLWREAVFKRDNFTCRKCCERGGYLHPHHILNFAEHPHLMFAIDNGITLCKKDHDLFHKIFGLKHNDGSQISQFLI